MKPVTGSCRLTHGGRLLSITRDGKEQLYVLYKIITDKAVAHPAYTLIKADGEQYTVSKGKFGIECECADFIRRARLCKHAKSLKALGLFGEQKNDDREEETPEESDRDGA